MNKLSVLVRKNNSFAISLTNNIKNSRNRTEARLDFEKGKEYTKEYKNNDNYSKKHLANVIIVVVIGKKQTEKYRNYNISFLITRSLSHVTGQTVRKTNN